MLDEPEYAVGPIKRNFRRTQSTAWPRANTPTRKQLQEQVHSQQVSVILWQTICTALQVYSRPGLPRVSGPPPAIQVDLATHGELDRDSAARASRFWRKLHSDVGVVPEDRNTLGGRAIRRTVGRAKQLPTQIDRLHIRSLTRGRQNAERTMGGVASPAQEAQRSVRSRH